MKAVEISRLRDGQDTGGGWYLIPCPVRPHPSPALNIRDGGKAGLKVNCLEGCKRQTVLEALRRDGLIENSTPPQGQIHCTEDGQGRGDPPPIEDDSHRSLRAVELMDFAQMKLPPRELILAPWLHTQGLAMIHAPRGVGKTFLALGVSYAIASGGQFLRWQAPKPRGVLYLDGEMPGAALQERVRCLAHSGSPSAPFRIITPDLQQAGMPDLSDPDWQDAVDGELGDAIDLVVVDNISTLVRGGKENEAESWEPVQEWALRLRQRGKAVLFIHHSGKGGQQRGTSRREDVLDAVIMLKHPPDYRPEQGAVFQVVFEKARGFLGKDAEPFEALLSQDPNAGQRWTARSIEESLQEKVGELLGEGWSQSDAAELLGVHRSTVSRHAKKRSLS